MSNSEKQYSPSLLKGSGDNEMKVSSPADADRMLCNIQEMKEELNLESTDDCKEAIRLVMNKYNYKGDLRTCGKDNQYILAFKDAQVPKFSFGIK